jgi:vanillate monooxygenase ferredoxin subunit
MNNASNSKLKVFVARKCSEAQDVCSLELVPQPGETLPSFTAGSHIDVHLPGNIIRQYSLCNSSKETDRYVIAVLRDPASRGGSISVHEAVDEGDEITIGYPKNNFRVIDGASRHLLIAGGIGVTPILCMAEYLAQTGADFSLHYLARTESRAAFVERIRNSQFHNRASVHFDDGAPDQRFDIERTIGSEDRATHIYVCGPNGLISAVFDAARRMQWKEAQLHREAFSGVSSTTSCLDQSFEIVLARSGRTVVVPPDQTVTRVLAEVGVAVDVSCEQGVCGTCLTRVLDGTPDHRDVYLTEDERAKGDQFTPCCSRSKSPRLVIDL